MKQEQGITLITLIITVVILVILSAVAFATGNDSIEVTKLQNFNYELQQVQGKVDAIHEKIKNGDTSYITLGSNITTSTEAMRTLKNVAKIDYESIEDGEDYFYNETNTTYRYLTQSQLRELLDISSNPGEMIINFITREVINVDGFEYKGTTYYRLNDFGGSYVSTGSTITNQVLQNANNNNNSQVHRIQEDKYVSDGLILHYDAINNTGNGHSNNATVWKDLSGNGNDGTISGSQTPIWGRDYLKTNKIETILTPWTFSTSHTISVIFEPLEFYSYNTIWDNSLTSDDNECWIYRDGKIGARSKTNPYIAYAVIQFELGKRVQISITVDEENNKCSIYLNGEKINTIDGGINLNDGQLAFNGSTNTKGKNNYYNMKVYNRALTDEEVANNYAIDKARFGLEE